jgi:phage I-like protein
VLTKRLATSTASRRQGLGTNVRAAKVSAAGEGPVWNEVMPAGEWHRSDWGVIKADRAFFARMIANWQAKGSPELPIDRHHWGSSNEKDVTDPKAKAAVGWFQDFRIGASGNLEGLTKWLPEGKADVDAERFKYLSPEFHEAWPDAATGEREPTLFGASLLNDPYFLGHLKALAANLSPQSKEHLMTREELIAMFGLPADATDADIKAATRKAADAEAEKKRIASAAAESKRTAETRTAELETELRAAKELATASEKRLAKLEADSKAAAEQKLKDDTARLCAQLERDGKIKASEKAEVEEDVRTYGLDKATARWTKRSAVVQLGELGGGTPVATASEADARKALDAKVSELEKSGVDPVSAYRRASKENPELVRAAFPNSNRASA